MSESDEFEPVNVQRALHPRSLIDHDLQHCAEYSGLHTVSLQFGGAGVGDHVAFNRASTSGSFRHLSGGEARIVALQLREINDTPLGDWLAGGDRDDLLEVASALESAATALETADNLDSDMIDRMRTTLFMEGQDDA